MRINTKIIITYNNNNNFQLLELEEKNTREGTNSLNINGPNHSHVRALP